MTSWHLSINETSYSGCRCNRGNTQTRNADKLAELPAHLSSAHIQETNQLKGKDIGPAACRQVTVYSGATSRCSGSCYNNASDQRSAACADLDSKRHRSKLHAYN